MTTPAPDLVHALRIALGRIDMSVAPRNSFGRHSGPIGTLRHAIGLAVVAVASVSPRPADFDVPDDAPIPRPTWLGRGSRQLRPARFSAENWEDLHREVEQIRAIALDLAERLNGEHSRFAQCWFVVARLCGELDDHLAAMRRKHEKPVPA